MTATRKDTLSSPPELRSTALEEALAAFGLLAVLEEFNQQAVRWAFPREEEQMLSALEGGPDVDLWVSARSFRRALEILESHSFQVAGGAIGAGAASVVRFRPPNEREWIILEVHVGCYWGQFTPLMDEERILRGLEGDKFNFFGAGELLLISTVRVAIRGGLVANRLERARRKWSKSTETLRAEWRKSSNAILGTEARMLEKLLENTTRRGKLGQIVFPISSFIHSPNRWSYLVAGFSRHSRRLRSKLFGTRLVIAAIGVDGSGKSSVLASVQDVLDRDGISSTYLYGGRTRRNSLAVRTVRKIIFRWRPEYRYDRELDAGQESAAEALPSRAPGPLVTFGSLALYTLDYWLRFGWVVVRRSRRLEVVLIDRGPDDLVTKPLPRRLVRFFQHLAPKTNLVIFCDAPAETIWERKRERSLKAIQRRQDLYARHIAEPLAGQLGTRIDTSKSLESSVADAVNAIWLANLVQIGALDRQLFGVLLRSEEL